MSSIETIVNNMPPNDGLAYLLKEVEKTHKNQLEIKKIIRLVKNEKEVILYELKKYEQLFNTYNTLQNRLVQLLNKNQSLAEYKLSLFKSLKTVTKQLKDSMIATGDHNSGPVVNSEQSNSCPTAEQCLPSQAETQSVPYCLQMPEIKEIVFKEIPKEVFPSELKSLPELTPINRYKINEKVNDYYFQYYNQNNTTNKQNSNKKLNYNKIQSNDKKKIQFVYESTLSDPNSVHTINSNKVILTQNVSNQSLVEDKQKSNISSNMNQFEDNISFEKSKPFKRHRKEETTEESNRKSKWNSNSDHTINSNQINLTQIASKKSLVEDKEKSNISSNMSSNMSSNIISNMNQFEDNISVEKSKPFKSHRKEETTEESKKKSKWNPNSDQTINSNKVILTQNVFNKSLVEDKEKSNISSNITSNMNKFEDNISVEKSKPFKRHRKEETIEESKKKSKWNSNSDHTINSNQINLTQIASNRSLFEDKEKSNISLNMNQFEDKEESNLNQLENKISFKKSKNYKKHQKVDTIEESKKKSKSDVKTSCEDRSVDSERHSKHSKERRHRHKELNVKNCDQSVKSNRNEGKTQHKYRSEEKSGTLKNKHKTKDKQRYETSVDHKNNDLTNYETNPKNEVNIQKQNDSKAQQKHQKMLINESKTHSQCINKSNQTFDTNFIIESQIKTNLMNEKFESITEQKVMNIIEIPVSPQKSDSQIPQKPVADREKRSKLKFKLQRNRDLGFNNNSLNLNQNNVNSEEMIRKELQQRMKDQLLDKSQKKRRARESQIQIDDKFDLHNTSNIGSNLSAISVTNVTTDQTVYNKCLKTINKSDNNLSIDKSDLIIKYPEEKSLKIETSFRKSIVKHKTNSKVGPQINITQKMSTKSTEPTKPKESFHLNQNKSNKTVSKHLVKKEAKTEINKSIHKINSIVLPKQQKRSKILLKR